MSFTARQKCNSLNWFPGPSSHVPARGDRPRGPERLSDSRTVSKNPAPFQCCLPRDRIRVPRGGIPHGCPPRRAGTCAPDGPAVGQDPNSGGTELLSSSPGSESCFPHWVARARLQARARGQQAGQAGRQAKCGRGCGAPGPPGAALPKSPRAPQPRSSRCPSFGVFRKASFHRHD